MGHRAASRLVRRGLSWLLAVSFVAAPALARAQDAKPAVVAAFHSYQKFLDHLKIAANFSGLEKFPEQFGQTVAKLLQADELKLVDLAGIDRGRPLGLMVFPGDETTLLAFLPVSDFAAGLAAVQPLTGEALDAGDGLKSVTLMGQTLLIKEHNGWAFLSPQREALANPVDPMPHLGDLLQKYEAGVRVDLTGVTAEQRQGLVDAVEGMLGAGLQQQSGESDAQFTFRKQTSEQQLTMVRTLLGDAEQMEMGMRLDAEKGTSIGDVVVKAASGSVTAAHLAAMGAKPSRVGGMLGEQDALGIHVNLGLDADQIKNYQGHMEAYRGAVRDALTNNADAGEPEHRQVLEGLVDRLFDGLKSSLAGGQLNVAARIKNKVFPVTLVAGMATESSANLDALIREFGELAKSDPGFTKVEIDVAKQGDVAIHGFELEKEKPAPGARPGQGSPIDKIFKTRMFYVAAAGDRTYVAFGPKALDEIKEALQAGESKVDPIFITANASTPVALAGMTNADPTMGMAFSVMGMNLTFGADQPLSDRFVLKVNPSEGGMTGHMEMGNGLLRVIAVVTPLLSQFMGQR